MRIQLYIEGGGDSDEQDTQFRRGWRRFFENAGLRGRMPAVFRGGGRGSTFDDFQTAVLQKKAGELPLLLVDSEDVPTADHSAWTHLQTRKEDGWEQPSGTGDNDVFLMVVCMETWFIADRESLRRFFGQCWRDNALPKWHQLEEISKEKVQAALDHATAACGRRRYAKGKRSFTLLENIDPAVVESKCPSAKRLLERLRNP